MDATKEGTSSSFSSSKEFFCSCCDIDLYYKGNYNEHLTGKKHKKNLQVLQEKQNAECTIFVSGLRGVGEREWFLRSYFKSFGNVQNVKLGLGDFAFVRFDHSGSAKNAIRKRDHRYKGFSFRTLVYRYKDQQQKVEEKQQKTKDEHQSIREMLSQNDNLPHQFYAMSEHLLLSHREKTVRSDICQELTSIFFRYFETCSVHQFGSSINGYGMKGCDLDLFLDFYTASDNMPASYYRHKQVSFPLPFKPKGIKTLTAKEAPLSREQLEAMDDIDKVKFVCQILRTYNRFFKELVVVPSKRCPIVRFIHQPSGLKCDLSLNNRKALYNSQLLRLYSQDVRVQHLVVAVRFWARVQGLTSQDSNTTSLITSYALTWLVLYYLMQTLPRVIPLVEELAKLLKRQGLREEMVDSWKCMYFPLMAALPPSQNQQSTVELLKGFFQFYASGVDWKTQALSTHNGGVIQRQVLEQDPFYMDCNPGIMTVLDPFVLTHNILAYVNERVKVRFISEVKKAAEVTKSWTNQTMPTALNTKPWGLAELLIPSPPDPIENKKGDKGLNRVKGEQGNGVFLINLLPVSETLEGEQLASLSEKANSTPGALWCSLAQKMVLDVLETVYFVELKEDTKGNVLIGNKEGGEEVKSEDDGCVKGGNGEKEKEDEEGESLSGSSSGDGSGVNCGGEGGGGKLDSVDETMKADDGMDVQRGKEDMEERSGLLRVGEKEMENNMDVDSISISKMTNCDIEVVGKDGIGSGVNVDVCLHGEVLKTEEKNRKSSNEKMEVDNEREKGESVIVKNSEENNCSPDHEILSGQSESGANLIREEVNSSEKLVENERCHQNDNNSENERCDTTSKRSAQNGKECMGKRFKPHSSVEEVEVESDKTGKESELETRSSVLPMDSPDASKNCERVFRNGDVVEEEKTLQAVSDIEIEAGKEVEKKSGCEKDAVTVTLRTESKSDNIMAAKSVHASSANSTPPRRQNKKTLKEASESNNSDPMEEALGNIIGDQSQVLRTWSYSCCCKQAMWCHRGQLKTSMAGNKNLKGLALEREISRKVALKLESAEMSKNKSAVKNVAASSPKADVGKNSSSLETNKSTSTNVGLERETKETKHAGDTTRVNSPDSEDKKLDNANSKTVNDAAKTNVLSHENSDKISKSCTENENEKVTRQKQSPQSQKVKRNNKSPSSSANRNVCISFSCKILECRSLSTSVPRVCVLMHAKPDHLGAFRNLFLSASNAILHLVYLHLLDQDGL